MSVYGPKRAKRTIPTLRDGVLDTVARTDKITVTHGTPYHAACEKLVGEGLLVMLDTTLVGVTYGKGW